MSALPLKPCPFCGHETPEFERMGTPRQSCIVACGNCGARHESSDEGDRCGSSWNQREYGERCRALPAGFVAVPVEPTEAMMDAVEELTDDWPRTTWKAAWTAMLAAAPQPEVRALPAPLTDEVIDQIANEGRRNAAGGIYATSVHEFARAVIAEYQRINGIGAPKGGEHG